MNGSVRTSLLRASALALVLLGAVLVAVGAIRKEWSGAADDQVTHSVETVDANVLIQAVGAGG